MNRRSGKESGRVGPFVRKGSEKRCEHGPSEWWTLSVSSAKERLLSVATSLLPALVLGVLYPSFLSFENPTI